MTARLVIYDGDFGIDDAMALLYLTAQPDVTVLAVGSVHGNTRSDQAAANAIAVLDVVGLDEVPVAVGAARPLALPSEIDGVVHGDDGLGGRAPVPSRGPVDDVSAAERLIRLIRTLIS